MKYAAIPLLLALAACDAAAPPASAPVETAPAVAAAPAPQPTPVAAARATCPDADFDAFLKRFEGSADVQRASTADPLAVTRIDPDAQPEPAAITTQVPLAEVRFPVLADAATRQAEGSQLSISARGENARDVTIARPDSGAQVRMTFEKRDCWTLVKVDDQSM